MPDSEGICLGHGMDLHLDALIKQTTFLLKVVFFNNLVGAKNV